MASPLKHFTNAKKKINTIFSDIALYIKEFEEFLDDTGKSDENDVINEVSLEKNYNRLKEEFIKRMCCLNVLFMFCGLL